MLEDPDQLPGIETKQPPRETKAEAFERMAPPRVTRALDAIRLIGNLSARHDYEYSPADVEQIFRALRKACDDAETRFRNNSPREAFALKR